MSACKDCFKGVRHEGTPEGKWEKIAGVDCYISTPSGAYAKEKVLLLLADAFGPVLPNNQLLADDFARNGFKVVAPDYFAGEAVPDEIMNDPERVAKFDIPAWCAKNGNGARRPLIHAVIDALKAEGVTDFGATGYCFGGWYTFDLASDRLIKAASVSHPSFLKSPEDLEKYANNAIAPLLINSCEVDDQFPLAAQAQADAILGNGKFAPGYKRTYWEGCVHGFAVRGDMSDPKVKAGKEGAFEATVQWMKEHL
ncbi:alpha/beta-hydrolase [Schizophyllum commune H4-8]|uniref:Dienelactone hydrolase domain-containing protein n=1 Tax=Schizophyllum commune (strain H4-8 / FGSC 9210) TaxID=578458 RepID=D8QBK7_SCHCM|nr:alpha/beta-hydrolase [Schizophyllum commune H4-8]KAI5889215.1 alpha/beta-hydrolase [Schizophyllum commune H4-8]